MSNSTVELSQEMLAVELPWPVSNSELVPESDITVVKLLELTIKELKSKLDNPSDMIQSMVTKALAGRKDDSAELEQVKEQLFKAETMNGSYLKQIGEKAGELLALNNELVDVSEQLSITKLENETLTAVNAEQAKEIESVNRLNDDRERAWAETDLMRNKRIESEQLAEESAKQAQNYKERNNKLETECKALKTELRRAKDELAGVPKLIENKVAAALSEKTVVSTSKLSEANQLLEQAQGRLADAKAKNTELNQRLGQLSSGSGAELKAEREKVVLLEQLTENLVEENLSHVEATKNADANYHQLMYNLEEIQGFAAVVATENVGLRRDNLYLDQIRDLHNMKCVWSDAATGWQAFFIARSGMLDLDKAAGQPDPAFGILFLVNTEKGGGHTAYFDVDGNIHFPIDVPAEIHLPKELHESFKTTAMALPVKEMEKAVKMSTERSRKIVQYASLLDIQWNTDNSLTEIAQRLHDYMPESELERVLKNIERTKSLSPKSINVMERIVKRYGSEHIQKYIDRLKGSKGISNSKGSAGGRKSSKKRRK